MEQENKSKVGIGVLIFKESKVLLGKRAGSHGAGVFAGLGGHLEYMESFAECATRETREEAGIEIQNIRFLCLTNLKSYPPKHYVDICLAADWKSGAPRILEPEKCSGWDWYGLDNLPAPLFAHYANCFEALRSGRNFFDA